VWEAYSTAVAYCEDILLDVSNSTGNGNRPLNYTWEEEAGHFGVAVAVANDSNNGTLQVDAGSFQSGTWSFTVMLTNWLGESTTATVAILWTRYSVPSIAIDGGTSQTTRRGSALRLYSRATVCGTEPSYLAYTWTETLHGLSFTSMSTNPRYLTLAPFTLTAATNYSFGVTTSYDVAAAALAGTS
ncbi:unnamed protein product, partial [Phaeothamnion confervicola]